MTSQVAIVLNDGQATPVAHTFTPAGSRAQPDKRVISAWRDLSLSNLDSFWSLQEAFTPVNSNGMEKYRFLFDVPSITTPSSGAPFRDYGTIASLEVWSHRRATLAQLKDIVALTKNFAASSYFYDTVTLRSPTW